MNNYYILQITCKNPKQFIHYLYNRNIDIWQIKYIESGLIIKVNHQGYIDILKIKTSYKIEIIDIIGVRKIKWIFIKNKMYIIFFAVSLATIFLLSNIIFKIEYIGISDNIKLIIEKELKSNNLRCFTFKKNYYQLSKIKHDIKKNNSEIEWIEINNEGVKLIVRAIERKDIQANEKSSISNIVAAKDGFLISIKAISGEVVKNPGDYVKKGDIIISGIVKNNDETVNIVESKGKVYAEVWYQVKAEEFLQVEEKVYDEKSKISYAFYILGKRINLFKRSDQIVKEAKIIDGKVLMIVKETRKKVKKQIKNHTPDQMLVILEQKVEDKIKGDLKNGESIIMKKTLKKYLENGKMKVEVFLKVKEEISLGQKIDMVE